MYQNNIYIPTYYRVWYHEYGTVMENQQTKEKYRIVESSIEDLNRE
jgi:hypothetical protein